MKTTLSLIIVEQEALYDLSGLVLSDYVDETGVGCDEAHLGQSPRGDANHTDMPDIEANNQTTPRRVAGDCPTCGKEYKRADFKHVNACKAEGQSAPRTTSMRRTKNKQGESSNCSTTTHDQAT